MNMEIEENSVLLTDSPRSKSDPDSKTHVDINEALENAGFGCGTLLYTGGSFLVGSMGGSLLIVLSFIGPTLRCEWELSSFQLSCLNISTYITQSVVSLITAPLGDRFGRRPLALTGSTGMLLFGMLCASVRSYWELLILRIVIGVFCGVGTSPAYVLSGEVPPKRYRALALSGMCLAFGVGIVITGGIAYLTLGLLGWTWRSLLLGSSLFFSPCVIFFIVTRESPRYHYYNGDFESAEKTIKILYKMNGKENFDLKLVKMPEDMNAFYNDKSKAFSLREVVTILRDSDNIRNTFILLVISILTYFNYFFYGYSMPRILNEGYCTGFNVTVVDSCYYDQSVLFNVEAVNIAEPVGLIFTLLVLDKFGRRSFFTAVAIAGIVLSVPLYFCIHRYFLTTFLFLVYPVIAGLGLSPVLLISELMPTVIRATMGSLMLAAAGVGSVSAMFIADFVLLAGPRYVIAIFQVVLIAFTVSIGMLNKETVGADLT